MTVSMKRGRFLVSLILVSLAGMLLVEPARAQYASVLDGSVSDQSQAVIAGAKIGVVNIATGVRYQGVTTPTGSFRIAALPAGTYHVTVEAPGFKTWSQEEVVLEPNQVRTINPILQAGSATTTVNVTASEVAIETDKSETAGTVETKEITEAALYGRNVFTGVAALAPLVTGNGEHTGGTATFTVDNYGTEISPNINAAGQRMEDNEFHLDGSLINLVSQGGVLVVSPDPDAVEEVKTTATDFSADRARFSGALIQAFTKPGTNQFHGTLSEFHTDNLLTSRTEFQQTVGTMRAIPVFRRNEFGGTFGGPIIKDKLFFFGSVSALRGSRANTIANDPVETPQFVQFLQANFPNNIGTTVLNQAPPQVYPTTGIMTESQLEAAGTAFYPVPPALHNNPSLPVEGLTTFQQVLPRTGLQWHFRIDEEIRQKDRIFFSMWRSTSNDVSPNSRPIQAFHTVEHGTQGKVNWVHTFTPALLNEASMSGLYTYSVFPLKKPELPQAYVGGIDGPGTWGPGSWGNPDFSWHDVLSWQHGSHNLRSGIDIDRQKDFDNFTALHNRATWVFGNLLDFAQDKPYFQSGPTVNTATDTAASVDMRQRIFYMAPFVQDDWKINPRFHLNLGIRYDYFGHLASIITSGIPVAKFTLGPGSTFTQQVASGFMQNRGGNKGYQTNNRVSGFAPRIGFGWDIFGDGTTALRGGYGIYYNRLPNEAYRVDEAPPQFADPTISIFDPTPPTFSYSLGPVFQPPPSFKPVINPAGGIAGARVAAYGLLGNLSPPLTHSWMLSVQRTLGHDYILEADYAGTHSGNLYVYNNDINRFPDDLIINKGTLMRLNPYFGPITFARDIGVGDSHYGSIMINKRYSKSFSVRGIFTFGKATDDNSSVTNGPPGGSGSGTIVDPTNLRRSHGLSDYSIAKRFTLDGVAELPVPWKSGLPSKLLGGWRMTPILLLQSGLPFTVYCSTPFVPVFDSNGNVIGNTGCDYNADGFAYDYPNRPTFGSHISLSRHKLLHTGVFQVSDFPTPPLGQEGNLGRNSFIGPGMAVVNVNFAKGTKFGERTELEFRTDIFNLFNRPNLGNPVGDMASGAFGLSTSQDQARTVQFGLHLSF